MSRIGVAVIAAACSRRKFDPVFQVKWIAEVRLPDRAAVVGRYWHSERWRCVTLPADFKQRGFKDDDEKAVPGCELARCGRLRLGPEAQLLCPKRRGRSHCSHGFRGGKSRFLERLG